MTEIASIPIAEVDVFEEQDGEAVVRDIQRAETPKPRGAKRLLKGLQRLSSSPSISRLRSPSSSYRGTGKGSVSCVSLNTASLVAYGLGSAYGSRDFFNGYSTAPTSAAGTPGLDTPYYETAAPWRHPLLDGASPGPRTPLSVPAIPGAYAQYGETPDFPSIAEDYFSLPVHAKPVRKRAVLSLWHDLPYEVQMHILSFLSPKQIVQCSAVSKSWHKMCFDGQLWFDLDTQDFYKDIPAEGLVNIIKQAGPFIRDLNLRNCVQLWENWHTSGLMEACRNLENLSLQDCRIDRRSIHQLINSNLQLQHINLSNLTAATNVTMKIIAENCPRLELLNVEWCVNVDTRGLRHIVEACPRLKDLRAGETRGWNDMEFLDLIFEKNTLERLLLPGCDTVRDDTLQGLFEGSSSEIDYISGRRVAPPRKLRHINFARCRNLTDTGLNALVGNVPYLEGLQLSKCKDLTDVSLRALLPTVPSLTHLDIDELENLTNATLQELAQSPCKDTLQHLCISYCDNLGDAGMLPIVKACHSLRSLDLDNTRISDLTLAEAAAQVRQRVATRAPLLRSVTWDGSSGSSYAPNYPYKAAGYHYGRLPEFIESKSPSKPKIGLRMTVYDCQNVTWTGIREVLSRNAEVRRPPQALASAHSLSTTHQVDSPNSSQTSVASNDIRSTNLTTNNTSTIAFPAFPTSSPISSHPTQIIALKVFYGYQQTVREHTRRVLRGDFAAASRLESKWAEYMMASEEAGAAMGVGNGGGTGHVNAHLGALGLAGNRRRRRRVREAQMMHADEEGGQGAEGAAGEAGVVGRRRRARTAGGCIVM